ncbi:MAG: hypothetical protein LBS55_11945 [Prevotellaceae bacterium]|jgi:lipopolysaccharide biosynthesis glycosyltransferase|nr:hypothetical protein [Prevotellaceae bacterium]
MVKIVVNKDKKNTGIFIPIEDFENIKPSIKAGSQIDKMMDELTESEKMREMKSKSFNADMSLKDSETVQQYKLEEFYISTFLSGKPVYYKDNRCRSPLDIIRAEADGSEIMISYDWQTNMETEIQTLANKGEGKYAYLLHDPRFLINRRPNSD